ncbi:MAG: anti-anti-sigma factor, partial [Ferruginibacter sp.]|nr:anti-anti-sigma factor [Ferruginibacter sp.]
MNVKIDTKEKFTVIGLNEPDISANMTAEMGNLLSSFIKKTIPHLVLNMSQVKNISDDAAYSIAT